MCHGMFCLYDVVFILKHMHCIYTENWIVQMGHLLSIDRLMQTSSLYAKQNSVRAAQTRNSWR